MAILLPFSSDLTSKKKKSALEQLQAPLITATKPAAGSLSLGTAAAKAAKTKAAPTQASNPIAERASEALQDRPAPFKPQSAANSMTTNPISSAAQRMRPNPISLNTNTAQRAQQILESRPAPLLSLKTLQQTPRQDEWKQYYDEEFKKAKSQQGFLERLLDDGSASRLAEQKARNRYASNLVRQAYDDHGNVIDQKTADLARSVAEENSRIGKTYGEIEHAKSRAIGASSDSDYYTGFSWDPNKNKSTGNPLESLGKQLYATANTVRRMNVGSAILGADDTQKTTVGDAGRFLVNLIPGVATAPIVGATNLKEAISGKGTDPNTGQHRSLDVSERLGRGGSGAIDLLGTFFGGSGSMIKSTSQALLRKGGSEIAEQVAKQTTKGVVRSYVKAMLEEGTEEGVQQVFDFFGNGGKLTTQDGEFSSESFEQLLHEVLQSAALGAVGGGVFKGVGDINSAVISNIRTTLSNRQDGVALSQKVDGVYRNAVEGIQKTFDNLHSRLTRKVDSGSVDVVTAERIEATVAKVASDMVVEQAQKINVTDSSVLEQVEVNRITPEEIKTRVSQELDSSISMDLLDELWGKSESGSENNLKTAQFEMLQKTNPMADDYHTGIRSADEILTFAEALSSPDAGEEFYVYPDWTIDKAKSALESGKVTVYSSHPIKNGVFVSPSKMMAQDYAGNGKVYSKTISIDDVGWINGDEGNYLPVAKSANKTQATEVIPKPKPSFNEAESTQRLNGLATGKLPYEEYSKIQSDRLWSAFQESNGGVETFLKGVNDYNSDGSRADVSRHTISSNGTLYRQLFDEYGRKPSRKLFNEALEDVLVNGEKSKYYGAFKEFDPETGLYNTGSDDIDTLIAARDYVSSSEYKDMMSRSEKQKQYDADSRRGEVKTLTEVLNAPKGQNYVMTLLRGVSDKVKNIVKNGTGRDISGYNHVIDSSAAQHALRKHSTDQIPLKVEHLNLITDIIKNPDSVGLDGKNRHGLDVIKYTKTYGDRIVYLEEVRNGRHQLTMNTMYWQPAPKSDGSSYAGPQQAMNLATDPLRASSRRSDDVTNDSVSQIPLGVNQNTPTTDIDADAYVDQQVKLQQKQSKTPLQQRVSETTAQLKHYLVDDSVAYEKYLSKAEKNKPTPIITDGMSFKERMQAKREAKNATTVKEELREGVDRVRSSDMIARQFMEDNGLNEIGKMSNKALNTFQQYLIAKRAVELENKGVNTGRNLEADQQLISSIGSGFTKQEKIVRDYNKRMLDYMAEKSLIAPELKDQLLRDNPNYVPFNRVMEEIEGQTGNKKSKQLANIGKQTVIQRIKGSDLTVDNPIESMMKNTIRMINEGERNTVATKLASTEAFRENILAEGQKPSAGNDTLSFMVDGKKVNYEVPALVAKEMKNLNGVLPDGVNGLVKVLGAPTKLLRTGATSANPLFSLSNFIRDQGQTVITGNLKANAKGTPKAFWATFGLGKKAKELRAELSRNGIIGSEYRMTYGMKSGNLVKELQKANKLSRATVDRLRHPIETLADVIGRTEYFTRAQQYFGTDGDVTTKSQAARNNTLNFSRGGSVVKILNKVIPFLNAGVQGGRITVAQLKERPVRTTIALAATAGLAYAVKGIGEGQNEELWNRLGDEEKEQNLVIFTDKAHYNPESNRIEGVIKIPMPQMLYPVLGSVNNFKGKPEDAISLAGRIFTAITGIDANNPVNQLLPTAVKPLIEWNMNKNTYTGNEIVSKYDNNLNPEDKGKKYTSGLAREVAKRTGIDAPVIDNFISNWGGGLFKDLVKTMTDNPDNAKDGGGLGAMLGAGFTRRFLSGSITSQYEISEGLARTYKDNLRQSEAFRALSAEDQQKVLNAVDTDMNSIASSKAKLEQGRENEISKDLSERQKNLLANGMDVNEYVKTVTAKRNGNKIEISNKLSGTHHKTVLEKYQTMNSKEWEEYTYRKKSAEYDLAAAKYQNDIANGNLTTTERVKKEKELRRLKVSKGYDKSVREIYSLAGTKADIQAALDLAKNSKQRQRTVDELNKLNRAMYDAGVISAKTYRTRSRNINNSAASGSSRTSSKKTRKPKGSSATSKTQSSNDSEKIFKTPESGPGFSALLSALKGGGSTSASRGSTVKKPTLKATNQKSNVIGDYTTKIRKTNLGADPKITKKKG